MHFILTTEYQVERLKQSAKKLRRSNTMPHRDALDKVAQASGYKHWHHVTLCQQETISKFPDGIRGGVINPDSYVLKEVEYIMDCSAKGEARMVKVGSMIFFSTADGDAWMLDGADELALCLRWRGEDQPYQIEETTERFQVGWNTRYRVIEEAFHVQSKNQEIGSRTIYGYPAREIGKFQEMLKQ